MLLGSFYPDSNSHQCPKPICFSLKLIPFLVHDNYFNTFSALNKPYWYILVKEIKLAIKNYAILVRPVYRQCAMVSYTDFWSAYGTVFPKKRHQAVGKDTGKTNYIHIKI